MAMTKDQLVKMLLKYGGHKYNCAITDWTRRRMTWVSDCGNQPDCTCDWDIIRRKVQEL